MAHPPLTVQTIGKHGQKDVKRKSGEITPDGRVTQPYRILKFCGFKKEVLGPYPNKRLVNGSRDRTGAGSRRRISRRRGGPMGTSRVVKNLP